MKTTISIVTLSCVLLLLNGAASNVFAEDLSSIDPLEDSSSISELREALEKRDNIIADKDKAISELKAAFEEISTAFRNKVEQMDDSSNDAKVIGDQRDEALRTRDEAITQRDEAIKAREEAALISSKRISELEDQLSEKQDSLDKLQQAVGVKDAEIARLESSLEMTKAANQKEKVTLAYNIGCIYKAGRQYDRAEKEFLKALALAPDDPGIHYNLGILYDDNLNDPKKAKYHYNRFLELSPNDPDAPKVVEWVNAL